MAAPSPLIDTIFSDGHLNVAEHILGYLDTESFLASRLVCEGWRRIVNVHKQQWTKIKATNIIDATRQGFLVHLNELFSTGIV